MIKGRKLIYKNLFIEKSINIIPESKIYIKRNIQSFFIIYQHYDYSIKVINPNEKLIISSNVNNVDELYALISSLEQKIILPVLLERYTNHKALIMDQNLSISTTGIKYKNKDYLYNSLSGIELENGYFKLLANGKLWQIMANHYINITCIINTQSNDLYDSNSSLIMSLFQLMLNHRTEHIH